MATNIHELTLYWIWSENDYQSFWGQRVLWNMEGYSVPKEGSCLCTFVVKCKFLYTLLTDSVSRVEHLWNILKGNWKIHAGTQIIRITIKNILQFQFHVHVLPYPRLPFTNSFPKKLKRLVFSGHHKPSTKIAQWLWSWVDGELVKLYNIETETASHTLGVSVEKIKSVFIGVAGNDPEVENIRL